MGEGCTTAGVLRVEKIFQRLKGNAADLSALKANQSILRSFNAAAQCFS